jgi:O-methyltransferase
MMDSKKLADKYLSLLKGVLCASLYDESAWSLIEGPMKVQVADAHLGKKIISASKHAIVNMLRARNMALVRLKQFNATDRESGYDWPLFGYTMTGQKRLDALQSCIEEILDADVEGDFIETVVWRGGSAIFMRAILSAHNVTNRVVWCADSFEGMPAPKEVDRGIEWFSDFSDRTYMCVSLEQVKKNFARFQLLDDQVRFLKGWFCDTLPNAPVERLAMLRMDGDLYESTRDALFNLYHKISHGGYVIVDDYYSWKGCRTAVDEFRKDHNITAKIKKIDGHAILWKVQN